MSTSEKIKQYRLKNAWSQEQLAQLTSLSVRTIQRIEKGHPPGLETISALASVFNVTISELSDDDHCATEALDTRINDARLRVEEETRFYRSLIIALVVCSALVAINLTRQSLVSHRGGYLGRTPCPSRSEAICAAGENCDMATQPDAAAIT